MYAYVYMYTHTRVFFLNEQCLVIYKKKSLTIPYLYLQVL